MEENVAILVNIETFNIVMNFLSTQPFNKVANLIQGMSQSPGITQSLIDKMNVEDISDKKEEAPE